MTSRALILGCSGSRSWRRRGLLPGVKPWGFILFKRNIGTPDEVRALTGALRDCVGS
ncbi:beta-hexosaminidase, partial [Methylobacterium radiotolerans]